MPKENEVNNRHPHVVSEDRRLYVPHHEGWEAFIKKDSEREYCHFKNPGEDFFHLLLTGEIYLQFGEQKYCLNCALRYGLVTTDRFYWQRGTAPK